MRNFWQKFKESKFWVWFKAAGIRALKTMAETAVATIGVAHVWGDVNWTAVLSTSTLAGLLTLLMSVAGLPELKK